MRTTTSINFYCRPSKIGRNGQAPIELSIIVNGKRTYLQTSLKCDPKIFNGRKCPPEITQYTESLRSNVIATIADMTSNGIPLTAEGLKRIIQQGGLKSYTIQHLYDDFNKILEKRVKNGNLTPIVAKRYKIVEEMFAKHLDPNREVSDITPGVVQNFIVDIQGKYEESSMAGILTRLKTIIKYAIDNSQLKINPFQGVKIKKGLKEVKTIDFQDLNKIIDHKFNDRLQKVADMFIFACGSGLSYCDCCALAPEDFIDYEGKKCIFKERQKTKIKFYSVLLPWALEIAKKYNYDFKALKISNQKINAYLKEIQAVCDITSVESLHFHLARHFYAMHLLRKKIPISTISKALGHSNNSVITQHYAKALADTIVSDIGSIA